jgi:tetratricopeptide (TPR) repeat protein
MKRAALLLMLMIGAPALAADKGAAHTHARKANSLAAAGKCKQAVPEYNAAYSALKDPALLFNRAECLRKLGRADEAVHDYKKFLEEMPSAPNRGLVESRILQLDPSSGIQTKAIVQAPAPVVDTPAPPPPTPTPTPNVPEKEPEPAPTLQAAALRVPVPVVAEPEPSPPAPVVTSMIVAQPQPMETVSSSEKTAWLWLSVAAAVVAASAGGALYMSGKPRNP